MRAVLYVVLLCLAVLLSACGSTNLLTLDQLPAGDAERGAVLFNESINGAPPCSSCHRPSDEEARVPTLDGFGAIASTRVEGQDARTYAFYSIVDPGRHVVEGYGNAMYPYGDKLSPQQIADLIAYILSL